MSELATDLIALAIDLVALDSRSFVSNLAVAERVEAALPGFEIERLDYTDPAGVAKRVLVAHRGPPAAVRRNWAAWPSPATWTRCPTPAGRRTPGRPASTPTARCTAWAAPT